jgi:hypothetical protein
MTKRNPDVERKLQGHVEGLVQKLRRGFNRTCPALLSMKILPIHYVVFYTFSWLQEV